MLDLAALCCTKQMERHAILQVSHIVLYGQSVETAICSPVLRQGARQQIVALRQRSALCQPNIEV